MVKYRNINDPQQLSFDLDSLLSKSVKMMTVDEIFSSLKTIPIVDLKEDRRIERKVAAVTPSALGDYFSIFANTPPDGGIILIGVENDGTVSGCHSASQQHLNDLERAGDTYCSEARYECQTVRLFNKMGRPDFIVAVKVQYRHDKVVETNKGDAFIRRGESRRKLSDDEKRDLRNSKGEVDLESEPVKLLYPGDFKSAEIGQFVAFVRSMRRLSDQLSTEEILELRRLGRIKGGNFAPNLACALLFAKDTETVVPGCRIRFLRFNGTEERTGEQYNVIKDEWIEGTVPDLILRAQQVISSQLREFRRLGKDNLFYSVPEYPPAAWYEAVVNACVHRSHALRNMNIFVKMFDDRLIVESPGGFPPFVTPDNIFDMHQPRNPHLMDALFYMNFVQCAHEGTRRIRDYMKNSGLPAPIFAQKEITSSLVQVILKNDINHRTAFIDTEAFSVLGESLAKSLDEQERRIVNFVAENRTINVTQTSKLIGRRWQACKKILGHLVDRGILDHIHSQKVERDAFQYYTLKKKFSDKILGAKPS
jgi:ATP-dependent DNA helicase RecG